MTGAKWERRSSGVCVYISPAGLVLGRVYPVMRFGRRWWMAELTLADGPFPSSFSLQRDAKAAVVSAFSGAS